MLSQEAKTKLEGFGFDVSKLESAIKSDKEESLEVPNLKTEDEFKTMVTEDQKVTWGNNRFEAGKAAVDEIKAKALNDEHNLGLLEGDRKDMTKVIEALKAKTLKDANIDPDKKSEVLTEQINILKASLSKAEEAIEQKDSEFTLNLFNLEKRTEAKGLIPKEVPLSPDLLVDGFFAKHGVHKDDQKREVVIKNGEVIKDPKTGDPIPLKEVFPSWLDEEKILSANGMGGGDSGGGSVDKFTKSSEFKDYCRENNINPISEEGKAVLKEKRDSSVGDNDFFGN